MRAASKNSALTAEEEAHGWSAGLSRHAFDRHRPWCLAADDGEPGRQTGTAHARKGAQLRE